MTTQVLVVDDDDMALTGLEYALTQAGHEVAKTYDGREALAILRVGSCRLVISDCMMPEMDGVELCSRIRSEDSHRKLF